jgi:AraC-like DNA-binding protein
LLFVIKGFLCSQKGNILMENQSLSPNKKERIKLSRVSDLPQIELFYGINVTRTFSRHVHWVFSLGVIEEGTRVLDFQGGKYEIQPGMVKVISPGEVHSGLAGDEKGCTVRTIRLEKDYYFSLVYQITGLSDKAPYFPERVFTDPALYRNIIRLHKLLSGKGAKLEKEYLLLETLSQLIQNHAREKPQILPVGNSDNSLSLVCDYLKGHISENVSLEELAGVGCLSAFHLARLFTRQIGVPPHVYQVQLRLNKALELLRSEKPVSDVALETGFFDQSHFTRAFKKKFGITPGQYTVV